VHRYYQWHGTITILTTLLPWKHRVAPMQALFMARGIPGAWARPPQADESRWENRKTTPAPLSAARRTAGACSPRR